MEMYNWALATVVKYLCEFTIGRMTSQTMNEAVEATYG